MATGRIKTSLLSLPDELLSAIFFEVMRDDDVSQPAALVSTCRRIAPIVQQEIYRELGVGDNEAQFDVLSELCAKRPDLRALVRVLRVGRAAQEDDNVGRTINYTAVHPGIRLLHSDFPALHALSVFHATPADIFTILSRIAATTRPDIRELTLPCAPGSDNCLARLECLERLCLHGVDAAVLLPSIRRSRINHLHISVKLGFTDEIMLKLVNGPTCMENLKELQLDHVSYRQGPQSWTRHELVLALRRDKQYDLAQVKATLSPKSPQSCSPDGLREVMDAAHKNGIKIARYLVDDALTSNDYTTMERYLGEDGAGKAILRQRPRLADLIRKGMTPFVKAEPCSQICPAQAVLVGTSRPRERTVYRTYGSTFARSLTTRFCRQIDDYLYALDPVRPPRAVHIVAEPDPTLEHGVDGKRYGAALSTSGGAARARR
ncbi:hypothetical protein RHOSPDRAFT_34130 [Rhodotorula sp. JG-1b]|nr:hypothetical protein RHOSPDRAFT_34130 [Rhodotorula sp. JG-1b]